MSAEQMLVLAILGAAMVLFLWGRLRVDFVALLVVVALALTGLRTPAEAVAGFGSTVVVMIGSLLVVGEALSRTGVANLVGDIVLRFGGGSEGRIRLLILGGVALLGSIMSSTAVVALFLPVVLRVAAREGIAANRLLLPLAYAALISGMLTLVGTAPNLVVHAELRRAGSPGFHFFTITPIGLAVLGAAMLCHGLCARWLLPRPGTLSGRSEQPSLAELWHSFVPSGGFARLRVGGMAALVGQTPRQVDLGRNYGVRVIGVERAVGGRNGGGTVEPSPDLQFARGDVLTVTGGAQAIANCAAAFGLQVLEQAANPIALGGELGMAVVMVHPESEIVGRSLAEVAFRTRHHLHVAGLRRRGVAIELAAGLVLEPADLLLVTGPWSRIERLHTEKRDFVLLTLPGDQAAPPPALRRRSVALVILLAMVISIASGLLPVVTGSLLAALAMVMAGCIELGAAYRAMHWSSLVLVAGMLPLAGALESTGVLDSLAQWLVGHFAAAGPHAMLALVFLVTAGVSCFISNTATAVLMAPVAMGIASGLQIRPEPLAMTVAIACSSAYLTPMASPVITLVFEPGGYKAWDLLRAGLPLFGLSLLLCLLLIPWLLPF